MSVLAHIDAAILEMLASEPDTVTARAHACTMAAVQRAKIEIRDELERRAIAGEPKMQPHKRDWKLVP